MKNLKNSTFNFSQNKTLTQVVHIYNYHFFYKTLNKSKYSYTQLDM